MVWEFQELSSPPQAYMSQPDFPSAQSIRYVAHYPRRIGLHQGFLAAGSENGIMIALHVGYQVFGNVYVLVYCECISLLMELIHSIDTVLEPWTQSGQDRLSVMLLGEKLNSLHTKGRQINIDLRRNVYAMTYANQAQTCNMANIQHPEMTTKLKARSRVLQIKSGHICHVVMNVH